MKHSLLLLSVVTAILLFANVSADTADVNGSILDWIEKLKDKIEHVGLNGMLQLILSMLQDMIDNMKGTKSARWCAKAIMSTLTDAVNKKNPDAVKGNVVSHRGNRAG